MPVDPAILAALQRSSGGASNIDVTGAHFSWSPRHHAPPSPRLEPSRQDASSACSRFLTGQPSIEGAWRIPRWDHATMPARAGRTTLTSTMEGAR